MFVEQRTSTTGPKLWALSTERFYNLGMAGQSRKSKQHDSKAPARARNRRSPAKASGTAKRYSASTPVKGRMVSLRGINDAYSRVTFQVRRTWDEDAERWDPNIHVDWFGQLIGGHGRPIAQVEIDSVGARIYGAVALHHEVVANHRDGYGVFSPTPFAAVPEPGPSEAVRATEVHQTGDAASAHAHNILGGVGRAAMMAAIQRTVRDQIDLMRVLRGRYALEFMALLLEHYDKNRMRVAASALTRGQLVDALLTPGRQSQQTAVLAAYTVVELKRLLSDYGPWRSVQLLSLWRSLSLGHLPNALPTGAIAQLLMLLPQPERRRLYRAIPPALFPTIIRALCTRDLKIVYRSLSTAGQQAIINSLDGAGQARLALD